MRKLIVTVGGALAAGIALTALPAQAQTIAPDEAKAHVGQTVTVHAAISDVHTGRGGTTFLDIGGQFPDNEFAAVIFVSDLAKFPAVKTLKGKTVAISGPVVLYQDRPEIILKAAEQLKAD